MSNVRRNNLLRLVLALVSAIFAILSYNRGGLYPIVNLSNGSYDSDSGGSWSSDTGGGWDSGGGGWDSGGDSGSWDGGGGDYGGGDSGGW